MGQETIKLELIEWLTKLDSRETLAYLKIVKDSTSENDWWNDLNSEQLRGIERGLKDIDNGHVTSNNVVKEKYGI